MQPDGFVVPAAGKLTLERQRSRFFDNNGNATVVSSSHASTHAQQARVWHAYH
jgi:hypothetical protein